MELNHFRITRLQVEAKLDDGRKEFMCALGSCTTNAREKFESLFKGEHLYLNRNRFKLYLGGTEFHGVEDVVAIEKDCYGIRCGNITARFYPISLFAGIPVGYPSEFYPSGRAVNPIFGVSSHTFPGVVNGSFRKCINFAFPKKEDGTAIQFEEDVRAIFPTLCRAAVEIGSLIREPLIATIQWQNEPKKNEWLLTDRLMGGYCEAVVFNAIAFKADAEHATPPAGPEGPYFGVIPEHSRWRNNAYEYECAFYFDKRSFVVVDRNDCVEYDFSVPQLMGEAGNA